jgi:uncharacterized protein YjiS (DUF1127 family)
MRAPAKARASNARWVQFGSTAAIIEAIIARVRLWRTRSRMRRQLAVMNARELQDIGTCRSDIANEIAKPFWRK